MRPNFKHILLAGVILIIFWEFLAIILANQMVPHVLHIFGALFKSLQSGLLEHLSISVLRILVGVCIGGLCAIPLGMFLGQNKWIDRYFSPFVYLIYPIPKITFLPLIIIFIGIGDLSKITMITLIVFFQLLMTTRITSYNVNKRLLDSVRSLGGNWLDLYKHVVLPACLPEILNNLRIAIGTSIAVLFTSETYATNYGIGFFILDALSSFDFVNVYAGVISISLMGILFFMIIDYAEERMIQWKN